MRSRLAVSMVLVAGVLVAALSSRVPTLAPDSSALACVAPPGADADRVQNPEGRGENSRESGVAAGPASVLTSGSGHPRPAPALSTLPMDERVALIQKYYPHVSGHDAQWVGGYYCPGDVNRDDVVDERDLGEWARLVADTAHPLREFADVNHDGVVDGQDVEQLILEITDPSCDPAERSGLRAVIC